jgi:hypothetical protein
MPSKEQTMDNDFDRTAAQRAHDALTRFTRQNKEAAFRSGELALRAVVLVNGGAIIAVFFFLGSIATKATAAQMSVTAQSLIWFTAGITSGLIAQVSAYLTDLHDAYVGTSISQTWEHPYTQPGRDTQYYLQMSRITHIVAIAAGCASMLFFLFGVWDVRAAIMLVGN